MEYILMIIGAVLVNNIILVQFLGICPFLGVSCHGIGHAGHLAAAEVCSGSA